MQAWIQQSGHGGQTEHKESGRLKEASEPRETGRPAETSKPEGGKPVHCAVSRRSLKHRRRYRTARKSARGKRFAVRTGRLSGAAIKGRRDGRSLGAYRGFDYGLRVGIMKRYGSAPKRYWDVKVLYVAVTHGGTYDLINQGIHDGLKEQVRELHVVTDRGNVIAAADAVKPDLVLVLSGDTVGTDQIGQFRSAGMRTAVWFTDDPYYTDVTCGIAPHYDYVFTQELSCLSLYSLLGCKKVHYLPLAVDTQVFRPFPMESRYETDVCFLGTAWNNRLAFFDRLAPYLATKRTLFVGPGWEKLPQYALMSKNIRNDALTPEESARYLNNAKIVINNHRAFNDTTYFNKNSRQLLAHSVNPRTFEISACGSFQITDDRSDLSRQYVPGQEVETYSSPEELKSKIEHYLRHSEARRTIALNGMRRTWRDHTYSRRTDELLAAVFD